MKVVCAWKMSAQYVRLKSVTSAGDSRLLLGLLSSKVGVECTRGR